MIYYISDHHWGHKAVIWMSQRPFEDVHQMNMHMIEKWNEVVGEDDEVYYLGDFMYKMNPNTFVRNVLNNLNGKIYLIPGNHDKKHLKKYENRVEWIKWYHEMSYTHEEKTYYFKLFHYPIYSWDGMWRKSIHLHGHTHWNNEDVYYESFGNKLNVNCEFLNYNPISIVKVIDMYNNGDLSKS